MTPLMKACMMGHVDIIKLLLAAHDPVEQVVARGGGVTALIMAARTLNNNSTCAACVELVLEHLPLSEKHQLSTTLVALAWRFDMSEDKNEGLERCIRRLLSMDPELTRSVWVLVCPRIEPVLIDMLNTATLPDRIHEAILNGSS